MDSLCSHFDLFLLDVMEAIGALRGALSAVEVVARRAIVGAGSIVPCVDDGIRLQRGPSTSDEVCCGVHDFDPLEQEFLL